MSPGWDATDDEGSNVPPGLYHITLTFTTDDEEQVFDKDLFLWYRDPAEISQRPHTRTDENGRYSIPMGLLPVNWPLEFTLEDGEPGGVHPVSDEIVIYAYYQEGAEPLWMSREVVIDPDRDMRVDFIVP
ncbi:hypothetical protein DRQ53_03280 [bacterium]|nr:MAG: hypothetical protein DRQ53_03280 [bacterium]